MTSHPLPRLIGTSFVGLVLLAGCAGARSGSQPTRVAASSATTVPHSVVSGYRSYPSFGIVVGPPPSGSQPATTPSQALATCKCAIANLSPDAIEFGSFTDNEYGTIQADNSVHHQFQNTHAWIMTWDNGPCPPPTGPSGGSATQAETCEVVVFVSADTGQYLLAIAGDPAVVSP
jgi:hypothetical protein